MQSMIIGKVVSPEVEKTSYGVVARFGVLVGRNCQEFTCWENRKDFRTGELIRDPLYGRVMALKVTDTVCVLFETVGSGEGLRYYLRDVVPIKQEVADSVLSLFKSGN